MSKPGQTLSKKIFAGFAAILLIAMTALIPAIMDLREILVALGKASAQAASASPSQTSTPGNIEHAAALAAHASSFALFGTFLLVVASLLVAYAVTRAVNLPLAAVSQRLSACAGALASGSANSELAPLRQASSIVNDATKELRAILGIEDLAVAQRTTTSRGAQ